MNNKQLEELKKDVRLTPTLSLDTPELLLALLRETFGSSIEIASYRIGNRREDYLVLLLELHRPSLTLTVKLAGPKATYPCPFDRTAMLHNLILTQTKVPVPEVLALDVFYQKWPWRYLITRYIEGQEWAVVRQQLNHLERAGAYQQIGDAVGELHTLAFPGFGELALDGTVRPNSDFKEALSIRARQSIKSDRLTRLFLDLLEDRAELFSDVKQACLTHEDLHGHNILFQLIERRWQLAALLDFDKAWAGHHEIDLARLEFWTGMVGKSFWPAYNSRFALDSLYEQRRLIYQLLWCLEYAVTTPKHLADTQRLCRQLGLPLIENFE